MLQESMPEEIKTIEHLSRIRKLLKFLAWLYFCWGITLGIMYILNQGDGPFLAILIQFLITFLGNLMAFALCYGLSEIIRFLGGIWIRTEVMHRRLMEMHPRQNEYNA